MYKFVKTDAHPRLAKLTLCYERLAACTERAIEAVSNQSTAASSLKDLTEPEPRPGREGDIAARTAAHTSALLEQCAAFEDLHKVVTEAQALVEVEEYRRGYSEILEDKTGRMWWLDTYTHNLTCLMELLKEAIDALGRFKWGRFHVDVHVRSKWHTILPDPHFDQQGKLFGEWLRWAWALPKLDADRVANKGELHTELVLLSLLSKTAYTENEMTEHEGGHFMVAHQVKERLKKAGWSAEVPTELRMTDSKIEVRRPKNSRAPLMPTEQRGPGPRRRSK